MINYLVCPKCKCPLSAPTGALRTINCSRCNTWLEIDSQCLGTCFSCHKLKQETLSTCVEPTSEKNDTFWVKR